MTQIKYLKGLIEVIFKKITNDKEEFIHEIMRRNGWHGSEKFKKSLDEECQRLKNKGCDYKKIRNIHIVVEKTAMFTLIILIILIIAHEFYMAKIFLSLLIVFLTLCFISWYLYADCPLTTLENILETK